ncbi:hypothetical protein N7474_004023 [Penicillium riverlandense]|uniref:uncharacterized protein n=1 Tax=Penicillium riverlandense TaxID=1903569 RepID=UPI00254664E7|nr:uncharacterized protein N7474_004023 [Penicillium riverlandense]KAJ5818432.1 hypothetical protein N7474_004023 [Penicillium riverlandense]
MDEYVAPSLAAKAASAQQIQLYTNFVVSAYPCYFKATMSRLPINWIEYISSQCGGRADSPFDWAVRSVTTMYTGSLHNDPRYLDASRGLYLRALRGLSGLLGHMSTAKLDETMATAVVLAVYEMHSCTTTEGWIHHTCGIQALTRLRGAGAHLHGLGRALFIASRNTFVTSALVTGEACFLEESAWQELNEQIAAENARKPDSSVYTDITERAFREIVKLPGYVKRVRDLRWTAPSVENKKRPTLLYEVLAARAALRGIHTEFSVSVSTRRADHTLQTDFIGPIPHHFFDRFTSLSIKGIRSGILLLNYLIILLDPCQRSTAEAENRIITDRIQTDEDSRSAPSLLTPPWSPGRPRLMIKSIIGPETREPPTSDWMDRIATTMGMEGVRVNLVDDG